MLKLNDTVTIDGHCGKISGGKDKYFIYFGLCHADICKTLSKKLTEKYGYTLHTFANQVGPDDFFPHFPSLGELNVYIDELNYAFTNGLKIMKADTDKINWDETLSSILQDDLYNITIDAMCNSAISNNYNTTNQNNNNYETRLQNQKTSTRRGVVPKGRRIVGKKDKVAIRVGHLGYRICDF